MNGITSIPGVYQSATDTIRRSQQNLARDAHVVANSTAVDSPATTHALLDSRQQVLYTQVAARLISASDEMTRSLLDTHA
jgi:hypothetical protein